MIACKSRAVEDVETDSIRRSRRRILFLFYSLCACMHSVCTLYASLSAYIFVLSALLLSQTVFLYALYAVFFGVVFPHRVHSRFFDAYNAYNLLIVHPGNEADGTDENAYTPAETCDDREARMGRDDGGRPVRRAVKVRKAYRLRKQAVKSHSRFVEECLKMRAVEDRRTDNIKEEVEEKFSLFFLLLVFVCTLYTVCMHPRLHTFSTPQPYGYAYFRFCMHCMQSIPELCSRIACIVVFLMHTMHTSCEHNGSSDFRTVWVVAR